jgi:hypothetical protein
VTLVPAFVFVLFATIRLTPSAIPRATLAFGVVFVLFALASLLPLAMPVFLGVGPARILRCPFRA